MNGRAGCGDSCCRTRRAKGADGLGSDAYEEGEPATDLKNYVPHYRLPVKYRYRRPVRERPLSRLSAGILAGKLTVSHPWRESAHTIGPSLFNGSQTAGRAHLKLKYYYNHKHFNMLMIMTSLKYSVQTMDNILYFNIYYDKSYAIIHICYRRLLGHA